MLMSRYYALRIRCECLVSMSRWEHFLWCS